MSYDTGDKSIQCGRLNDAFKIWLMWKAKVCHGSLAVHYYGPLQGKVGLARQIDKAIGNTKYMAEQIKKRDGFELVSEPEYTNCCFWYYPPSMRGPTPPDPHKLTKVVTYTTASLINTRTC